MKLTLALLAVFAVGATVHGVPVAGKNGLEEHIMDFLKILPMDKIENLFYDYLSEDEDFAESLDYLQSEEFKSLLVTFESTAEFRGYLDFLEESGLPAYEYVNKFNELLGVDPIAALFRMRSSRISGGLTGFINDLKALLPVDGIKRLCNEKIANVPEFAKLMKSLESQEAYDRFKKLLSNPNVVEVLEKFRAKGVDINAVLEFVGSIFNFKFPTYPVPMISKSLMEHFNDFYERLKREEMVSLFYEYVARDADVHMTFEYLRSQEFKAKFESIESTPEFKEHLDFFESFNIPAYEFVREFKKFLEIDYTIGPHYFYYPITGGLRGLLKDLKELVPFYTIRKIYHEKFESAPEFAEFMKKLLSEDYHHIVAKLLSNKDIRELISKAEDRGVDFEAVRQYFRSIIEAELPPLELYASEGLVQELKDFVKLIPVQELENLVYNYLAEDEDFAEALDFVVSEEFKGKLIAVESTPEFKGYLNFLEKSGLPAYEYVNKFNAFMGIELIKPLHRLMTSDISGGLPGFVQDVKALLPIEDIKNLQDEKLRTSKVFAEFIQNLQSEEAYGLFTKLFANPTIQETIVRVESKGVDVDAILELVSSIFGFKFPPQIIGSTKTTLKMKRFLVILALFGAVLVNAVPLDSYSAPQESEDLRDDLEDFIWAKVPIDRLADKIVDYLLGDRDFQDVVKYMLSDEFRDTQADIEKLPEMKAVLQYLESVGMDVYEWINAFHELIGLPRIEKLSGGGYITGGITGLIMDIKRILPLVELRKLYDEKLKTSRKFREFIERLETKELQNFVNALGKHEGFNKWLKKLQVKGVDFDQVLEILGAIIGIKFPPPPPPSRLLLS
ncbi:uncharacterized protein LOC106636262 [Copidosoma floridanum]|uniref:uncharacterized protein LOC106636262 n=1 Tax=Copidosoma floridanum TaxID=29053 RepID=UPI000C6F58F2|nr:uncharacterized protein LOC106636262 [Copidosoma floridanum]